VDEAVKHACNVEEGEGAVAVVCVVAEITVVVDAVEEVDQACHTHAKAPSNEHVASHEPGLDCHGQRHALVDGEGDEEVGVQGHNHFPDQRVHAEEVGHGKHHQGQRGEHSQLHNILVPAPCVVVLLQQHHMLALRLRLGIGRLCLVLWWLIHGEFGRRGREGLGRRNEEGEEQGQAKSEKQASKVDDQNESKQGEKTKSKEQNKTGLCFLWGKKFCHAALFNTW